MVQTGKKSICGIFDHRKCSISLFGITPAIFCFKYLGRGGGSYNKYVCGFSKC